VRLQQVRLVLLLTMLLANAALVSCALFWPLASPMAGDLLIITLQAADFATWFNSAAW
jgi:hypothetical protein